MKALTTYRQGRPHGLATLLIVSLTSYPKRYPTLDLTIKSLLDQSVRPDQIILWLSQSEYDALPHSVMALQSAAFGVRVYPPDLRSYVKIVPTLQAFPTATIVTADDDVYYPTDWLEGLVRVAGHNPGAITCHRAHRPTYHPDGRLRPYAEWVWNAPAQAEPESLFPTGVGGVLYPPGSLDPSVVDASIFMALAPHADDAWLFFMGHLAGSRYAKVPGDFHLLTWPGSQATSLMRQNVDNNENDRQINTLEQHFGIISKMPQAQEHRATPAMYAVEG